MEILRELIGKIIFKEKSREKLQRQKFSHFFSLLDNKSKKHCFPIIKQEKPFIRVKKLGFYFLKKNHLPSDVTRQAKIVFMHIVFFQKLFHNLFPSFLLWKEGTLRSVKWKLLHLRKGDFPTKVKAVKYLMNKNLKLVKHSGTCLVTAIYYFQKWKFTS